MMRITARLSLVAAAALSYAALSGCGEKRYKAPAIEESDLVGQWTQVEKEISASSRRRSNPSNTKEFKFKRHLVINQDKTFVFSLRDLSGNPYAEDKKAEGTWAFDAKSDEIVFTVANSTFEAGGEGADWVPSTGLTLREERVSDSEQAMVLTIGETGGKSGKYKRSG